VIQKKTGRPVQFQITDQTRTAIAEWLAARSATRNPYLFPSRFQARPHLSTRQYAGIVYPASLYVVARIVPAQLRADKPSR